MRARAAALAALIAFSRAAQAQIYSWCEPHTGAKRFSNIAPAWYNAYADAPGPRVIVTAGGIVIDDTSLSLKQRWQLARRNSAPEKR